MDRRSPYEISVPATTDLLSEARTKLQFHLSNPINNNKQQKLIIKMRVKTVLGLGAFAAVGTFLYTNVDVGKAAYKAGEVKGMATEKAHEMKGNMQEIAQEGKVKANEMSNKAANKMDEMSNKANIKANEMNNKAHQKVDEMKDYANEKKNEMKNTIQDKSQQGMNKA